MQKLLISALKYHFSLWYHVLNQHVPCQGRQRPYCSEEISQPCLYRCLRWYTWELTSVTSSPATLDYPAYWNWTQYWHIIATERCVSTTLQCSFVFFRRYLQYSCYIISSAKTIANSTENLTFYHIIHSSLPSSLYFMLMWVIIAQSLQLQENNNENTSHAMCYIISTFPM